MNVLEIIVAKNSVNIVSDVDLEKIEVGDEIIVEVLGKKYELDDVKLSIVGRVVKDVDPASRKKKVQVAQQAVDIGDIGDIADIGDIGDIADIEEDVDEEAATEAEEEADEEAEEEAEEEDDERSSKGGAAFFSDEESVADADGEYELYGSEAESEGAGSDSDY